MVSLYYPMSNVTNNQKLKEKLERTGALKFDESDVPLSEAQWQMLETLAKDSEYEHVIGDRRAHV